MNQQPTQEKSPNKIHKKFQALANFVSHIVGSPFWFGFSVFMVIAWALSGFVIGFTQTWQLIINTTTTIMTFLMISLLHSSQKKWEDKMERLQNQEVSTMKKIHKETKRISLDETNKTNMGTAEQLYPSN